MKKALLFIFISAIILNSCSVGKTICDFALTPPKAINHRENLTPTKRMAEKCFPGINSWYDSLRTANVFIDTFITGEGGQKLHAIYATKQNAEGSVVLIHGYRVNHISMLHLAKLYRDSLNFNVIVPDLQYHGFSGGAATKMGWDDRRDAMAWVKLGHNLWNSDFFVVHGISMGAATTMMLSGEPDLPIYVRCLVEDCGYTSVWDEYNYLRKFIFLSEKGLQKASDYCLDTYGWDFKTASCIKQVAKCDRPMLFIHGNPDRFVPTKFVYELYDAKTMGYKELWLSEGAKKHAEAYLANMDEYTFRLKAFIAKARELTIDR